VSLVIAEDDDNLRYLLEAAAARAGGFGPIMSAPDGQAALDMVRRTAPAAPELIVTDLSMPRMTGLDLIRALKRDPATRGIPVAVVTSSDIPNDREDALAAGACAFLPKAQGFDALTRMFTELRATRAEANGAGQ
jgi:CheY-like chemotaxis protein